MSEAPRDAPNGMTVDELAAATGLPSRTIRYYRSKGALMAPEIRGRVAYYSAAHADRLKLIAQLQDRGLRIDAIADLLTKIDRGELELAAWLGVEEQVQSPWAHDQPRTLNEEELYALVGERRPGLIAELVRVRLVERRRGIYFVPSPALLLAATKLDAVGVELDVAVEASATLKRHLTRAVDELVATFVARFRQGHVDVHDSGPFFEALRGAGTDSVRVLFARAMEKALRELSASGKVAELSAAGARRRGAR